MLVTLTASVLLTMQNMNTTIAVLKRLPVEKREVAITKIVGEPRLLKMLEDSLVKQ